MSMQKRNLSLTETEVIDLRNSVDCRVQVGGCLCSDRALMKRLLMLRNVLDKLALEFVREREMSMFIGEPIFENVSAPSDDKV